jgi:hypothetical protein
MDEKLKEQLREAKQLVLDLFLQSCSVDTYDSNGDRLPKKEFALLYDHMCISVYEEAQCRLIEWGLIEKERCLRY